MLNKTISRSIALLDPNIRRRADICHKLQAFNLRIEPFDWLEEIPLSGYDALLAADGDGIPDLMEAITESGYRFPVIAYHHEVEVPRIVAAIRAGAVNYFQWPSDLAMVADTLNSLIPSAAYSDQGLPEHDAKSAGRALTARERAVLEGMANGLTNRMIGEGLSISARTVETHRRNLLVKLGAKNSTEAVRIALSERAFASRYSRARARLRSHERRE